jgi:hypothetical protein
MKVSTVQTKLDPIAQHLRNLKTEGFLPECWHSLAARGASGLIAWSTFRTHLGSKRLPFGGVDVRPIHRSEVLAAAVSVEDSRPTFGCAIEFTGWGSAAYPL